MYDRNNITLDKPKRELKVILCLSHFLLLSSKIPCSHNFFFFFNFISLSFLTLLCWFLLLLPWDVSGAKIPSFIFMSFVYKFFIPWVISLKSPGFDYCLYLNGSQIYVCCPYLMVLKFISTVGTSPEL